MKTLIFGLLCAVAIVATGCNETKDIATTDTLGGDFVIYPTSGPVHGTGPLPCGGSTYVGYISATRPNPAFGWKIDTNVSTHTFTDTNHLDTIVQLLGKFGDTACAVHTVATKLPPGSPAYRVTVYFTNAADIPPDTNYPIFAHGFLP